MKTTLIFGASCVLLAGCATDDTAIGPTADAGSEDDVHSMEDAFTMDDTSTEDSPSSDSIETPDRPRDFEPSDYPAVVFVHGNGIAGATDFDMMIERFIADGWPRSHLFAQTFSDPRWDCNVDNADVIAQWVTDLQTGTGASRVSIVAHSMGSLSSRYYMRNLGGHEVVHTYVTLGGMHHGLFAPCLSPMGIACTWDELCQDRAFIAGLNEAPTTPGPARWFSFYGTDDMAVPNASSELAGAQNMAFAGIDHAELLTDESVYLAIREAIE